MTDSASDFWNGLCAALKNYPQLLDQLSALGFPDDPQKRALFIEMMRDRRNGHRRPCIYNKVYVFVNRFLKRAACYDKIVTALVWQSLWLCGGAVIFSNWSLHIWII